ncbi:MAG: aldolase, partial [Proteobacteria bacterium]|nr:aldolase [Pseudomonadota bacterium]
MTLRDRIRSGSGSTTMPVGSMVFEFFVPGISRMARASGADFLIFDTEHSGTGIEAIKAQCAACDGVGIAPVVRVPEHGYHFVAGALDAGAHGVMVPMVGTAEQAREIVSFSHYPPAGRRGAAFGIAHDGYTPGTPQQKIAEADARTLVIAMIETPEGVANVDEIAAVPG